MNITNNELIALHQTLLSLSRQKLPFNVAIAKNLQAVEKHINEYSDKRSKLVEAHAKTDELGKLLGVMKPVKGDQTDPPTMERVKDPQVIDDIEWDNKEKFMEELTAFNSEEVELTLTGVSVKKKFFHMQHGRDFTIEEYLNSAMEPGMILYLDKMGVLLDLNE
jgi:hypothetical protein